MASNAHSVSNLLSLGQAAKGLMESPGWETFRDYVERKARDLYLSAVASGDTATRLRALDQAAALHEIIEGFGLEAKQWDQVLHSERLIEDQQYRLRARAATGADGRPRPYDADIEMLRQNYAKGE